jgi:site-specific recombinase XerC
MKKEKLGSRGVYTLERMNSHQQLENIRQHNRDGSYGTQAARADVLHQLINDLHKNGYSDFKLDKIGSRHIETAVKDWKSKELSNATMANRLSHCRWLSQKLNKQNIVPRTNKELGIGRRSFVAEIDKSNQLPRSQTMRNFTTCEQRSMQLARAFGLRREESMKFNVNQADKGNKIELKGSWCKGGRPRKLKVRTQQQRTLLNKIKALIPRGSLIEKDKTYIQALKTFEKHCQDNHLRMHGLRHAYALDRYKELTGRNEPTPRDKIDLAARAVIAKELGHISSRLLGYCVDFKRLRNKTRKIK